MIVPQRSRKGDQQMAENPRIVTVYVGSKIGPIVGQPDEELDGEAWEPTSAMVPTKAHSKKAILEVAPPPPMSYKVPAVETPKTEKKPKTEEKPKEAPKPKKVTKAKKGCC